MTASTAVTNAALDAKLDVQFSGGELVSMLASWTAGEPVFVVGYPTFSPFCASYAGVVPNRTDLVPGDPWNPVDPRNRERTRRLRRELRTLLMDWDPIGVEGVAEAWDEYDCLLSPVMRRLHGGTTVKELARFLDRELVEHFGLTSCDGGPQRVAATRICEWWARTTAPRPGSAGTAGSDPRAGLA